MGAFLLKMLLGGWNIAKLIGAAIGRFFAALNIQGWIGLCVSAALAFVANSQWSHAGHWHKQSDRFEGLYNAELAHEAKIAKQAVDLKTKIDTLSSSLTAVIKERNDEQNRRIAADVSALRLSGPGKAVCPGNPGAAAAPVRQQQAAAAADAPGSPLPPSDRAAVSWAWLVQRAQEHDELLSKVQSVIDQRSRLEQSWPQAEAPK